MIRNANRVLDAARIGAESDAEDWRTTLLQVEKGYNITISDSDVTVPAGSLRPAVSQTLRASNPRSPTAATISAGVLMDSEYVARRKAVREQRDVEKRKTVKGLGYSLPGKDWIKLDAKVAEEWVTFTSSCTSLMSALF